MQKIYITRTLVFAARRLFCGHAHTTTTPCTQRKGTIVPRINTFFCQQRHPSTEDHPSAGTEVFAEEQQVDNEAILIGVTFESTTRIYIG
jgi:hypothetical protein